LAQSIARADQVTVTIGNACIIYQSRRLDVAPGAVDDDGALDSLEVALLLKMIPGFGRTVTIRPGEFYSAVKYIGLVLE
jgi:hypothetical protein